MRMRGGRGLRHLIAGLIILGLAGGCFLYFKVVKPGQDPAVFPVDMTRITAVTIDREDHIRLEKHADQWWITAPIREKADQDAVHALLSSLVSLRKQPSLGAVNDPSVFFKTLPIVFKTGETSYSLTVGALNPTREYRYAKASTRPGVFLIKDRAIIGFDKDLLALRNRRLLTLTSAQVETLTIRHKGARWTLVKDQAQWHLPRADQTLPIGEVNGLLRAICGVEATFFTKGMSVGMPPAAEITLRSGDGAQDLKIWEIGRALFAQSSVRPEIVEIDREFLTSITDAMRMISRERGA